MTMGILLLKKPEVKYDTTLYERKLEELKSERDSLYKELIKSDSIRIVFKSRIDSLSNIKDSIRYVYIKKYKDIDNASVSDIVDEFKVILSEGT